MLSLIIRYAWLAVQIIVMSSLLLPTFFYVSYCIKKAMHKHRPESEETAEEKDYAIIVSVNGDTAHLQALLHSLLQLNYTNYLIYVVMNGSQTSGLPHSPRITVLNPAKPFGDAARVHRYAIENFKRPHTHLAVFDSHCLADAEYLNELNVFFNQGYQVVQGLVSRKKYRSLFDAIHSIAHSFNRFFYGDVSFALGSSSILCGNGSAFTISLYKPCLASANATGAGLSKVLQYTIVRKAYTIAFAPKAVLYNEKTMQLQPLINRHAYSTNVWLRQMAYHIRLCMEGINTLSFNPFLFGLLLLQPPLLTSFLSGIFCLLINVYSHTPATAVWMVGLGLFTACFLIASVYLKTSHAVRKLLSGSSRPASYLMHALYE